jgi:UDP-glucose 4-epimerase
MNILITGGAGFIGSHVVDVFRGAGHTVAIVDDLSTGRIERVPKEVTVYKGSITDFDFLDTVMAEFKPEIVDHHAAQVSVVVSTREPLDDLNRNIGGTVTVFKAAQKAGVRKMIYATSGGAMYGNPKEAPCTEESEANPVSPYGLSKLTAERYLWILANLAKLNNEPCPVLTVLRYANVYGPRQDPHGEAGVCAIFTERMLAGQPVTIFGDGTQLRDYVYVGDVAAANLAALTKGDNDYFNVGTGVGVSTEEVYQTIKAATGYTLEAERKALRPGEVQAIVVSPAKAKQGLNWEPAVQFKEGIKLTVQSLQSTN